MKGFAQKPVLFGLSVAGGYLLLPYMFASLLQFGSGFPVAGSADAYRSGHMLATAAAILLAVLLPGELWEHFAGGFWGRNLGKSLLMCLPMLAESACAVFLFGMAGCSRPGFEGAVLLAALQAGIGEELIFRRLILGNFLYQWRDRPNRFLAAVTASAVLFSLCHLYNLWLGQDLLKTAMQLFYTLAVGCLTGVTYVHTRNLLGPILIHCLHDLIMLGLEGSIATEAALPGQTAVLLLAGKLLCYGGIIGFCLYMLEKKKNACLKNLWADG